MLVHVFPATLFFWGYNVKVKEMPKDKKYKKRQSEGFEYNHEIVGILLIALGILITLSLYFHDVVGLFGKLTRDMLLGMMGLPAFIVPLVVLAYGILVLLRKDSSFFQSKALYAGVLVLIISSLIQTGCYDPKEYLNASPIESITKFYQNGIKLQGGGVLGGIISTPFLKVFQITGTIVILMTLSIIDIILLTNISFVDLLRGLQESIQNAFKSLKNKLAEGRHREEADAEKNNAASGKNDHKEEVPLSKIIDMNLKKSERKPVEKADVSPAVLEEKDHVQLVINDMKKVQPPEKPEPVDISKEITVGTGTGVQYTYPTFELLNLNNDEGKDINDIKNAALEGARKLEDTLKSFGVEAKVTNVSRGPAVTRYELQPSPGVKVSKIVNLSDDISLNLASAGVRIEAPIPGKAAVGIEVPNKEVTAVYLREVLESKDFVQYSSKLAFALGKDISGEPIIADIGKMPHVLVAGATGSGKSVCINSLIISLLYKASPEEVKLLMVDPKVVELGVYNGIPHLLIPVVTDPKKAAGALNWAVQEMVNRYKLFADKNVRDLKGYNALMKEEEQQQQLPQIVIIIDELADLMMVAPNDVEDAICRLAQMARAAGMHLVIATQRPSVDVITGVIKANIPSRIAFAVSSQVDSRTILDMGGAEKLLGKGDMLFYPVGEPKPIRIKGAFITDKEVEKVVEFIKSQGSVSYDNDIIDEINSESEPSESEPGDNDELLPQAIELVVDAGQASVSLIQRKFKVGYARAARIVDQMEARGVVGPFEGSKPRQVLISKQQWMEMQMANPKLQD